MIGRPRATVVMPTHDHARLIGYAIRSVQAQTLASFELFVVGDGAGADTRAAVEALARTDRRIRYFDFPKGERHGEAHRHEVLKQARGRIVAYCGDDDVWLPNHLATLARLLKRVDFGHVVQVNREVDGQLVVYPGHLGVAEDRAAILDGLYFFFGLTVGGHRLSAYLALAEGWTPAPTGLPTDQHMWQKFLRDDRFSVGTAVAATSIHFHSPPRRDWSFERREAELADHFARRSSRELRQEMEAAIDVAHPGALEPRGWRDRLATWIAMVRRGA